MDSVGRVSFFRAAGRLRRIECVSIHLNVRRLIGHVDDHDVEAAWSIVQLVPREEVDCHLCKPTLLPRRDRLGAAAEVVAFARLDLDERRDLVVARDDVNFSKPRAVATRKN